MVDLRGTEIKVRDFVAYNWQGQVAWGMIVKITPHAVYKFHVMRLAPEPQPGFRYGYDDAGRFFKTPTGKLANDVSKVRSPFNLLVLKEGKSDA